MKKIGLIMLILSAMILFVSCSGGDSEVADDDNDAEPVADVEPIRPEPEQNCPESCDDGKPCTVDTCSVQTNYECLHTYRDNCCGNEKCETGEDFRSCKADCDLNGISPELQTLLDTANKKVPVPNYKYTLKVPKTAVVYHYVVYDDKVRIDLDDEVIYKGFKYDQVYMDLAGKTAKGYCRTTGECGLPGYKFEFENADYLKLVPILPHDKLAELDNGEVFETVSVGSKESLGVKYINMKGEQEKIWIWTYYGMPVKYSFMNADGEEEVYEYSNLVVGSVRESDVTMPG